MDNKNYGIVEHVAVSVADINWHINFFNHVFGMTIIKLKGASENPEIVWLSGGIQLLNTLRPRPCGVDHLGIVVTDLETVLSMLNDVPGVASVAGKDINWKILPEGIILELIQGSVKTIRHVRSHPLRG